MSEPVFLYVACQPGAEGALKQEMAAGQAEWRFAFSRPGFLTFKWLRETPPAARLQLRSCFARTYGWSLGAVAGQTEHERLAQGGERLAPLGIQRLHVWQRQSRDSGGRLPQVSSPETARIGEQLRCQLVAAGALPAETTLNQPAGRGQAVGNCILLSNEQWWLGWHTVTTFGQRWAGGVPDIHTPDTLVSRAYLKLEEALLWSELPLQAGERCVDLGSAPGGASQALLARGLHVLGVDPAQMHPDILAHPNFTHLRKRGAEVRRTILRGCRWLVADANVAPTHTLDTVESIVTHESSMIRGLVLTLKLADWTVAERIGEFARRVKGWGFDSVRVRQLACNHQEVCLAALRSRGMRRATGRSRVAGQS